MRFRDDISEGNGGSQNFLRLKDKETVTGVFRGDIHELFVLWENGKSREVTPGTQGAKFRFRVNFVLKDGANYVPKIFEQGLVVYRQLADLHAEYDLPNTVVKITRNGTGTDTTYTIMPVKNSAIPKETAKYLSTLELLPLEPKTEQKAPSIDENEEIAF
jgi:hypothetical protein